jgi:hypothetical protein
MATLDDIKRPFAERDITLQDTDFTGGLMIERGTVQGEEYYCELIGPFRDPTNPDVRLFVTHRKLGSHETVTLLLQDRDDDAFLNSPHSSSYLVSNTQRPLEEYKAGHAFYLESSTTV